MPGKKRKFFGDGRWEPVYPPNSLPPECEGLDWVPSDKLPPEVNTVFFGGGWFALSHYLRWRGWVDGHVVYVSPFYISISPISIAEWKSVMGEYDDPEPQQERPGHYPAHVLWKDAVEYCIKRTELEGLEETLSDGWDRWGSSCINCDWEANGYRLPTEAEFNYAASCFKRRLPARPDPFPKKVDMKAYYLPYIDKGPFELRWRGESTMFWDHFDHRYFRESPIFDPTGPRDGFFHAGRYVAQMPWPSNNNFKPYRFPLCLHTHCQFYVARSRIFDYNLHNTNLRNKIPQWDQ